ncbi:MAG: hypothetical protein KDC79_11875 [Cyclobacteriaceae bacterium]|nr:hypothetical protein [Cyclobacteriaceae bacterium]
MEQEPAKERNTVKETFQLGEMWAYFINVFKKRDPNSPTSINLRLMHGINRITIVVFLLGVIYFVVKHLL